MGPSVLQCTAIQLKNTNTEQQNDRGDICWFGTGRQFNETQQRSTEEWKNALVVNRTRPCNAQYRNISTALQFSRKVEKQGSVWADCSLVWGICRIWKCKLLRLCRGASQAFKAERKWRGATPVKSNDLTGGLGLGWLIKLGQRFSFDPDMQCMHAGQPRNKKMVVYRTLPGLLGKSVRCMFGKKDRSEIVRMGWTPMQSCLRTKSLRRNCAKRLSASGRATPVCDKTKMF